MNRTHSLILSLLLTAGLSSAQTPWEQVPSPAPGGGSMLYGVDGVAADDVWAVGWEKDYFNQYSYDALSLVLHWDGSTWSVVPSPSPGVYPDGGIDVYLYDVAAVSATDVWAVGTYLDQHPGDGFLGFQSLALHWDGEEWTQVETPSTPVGGTGAMLEDLAVLAPDDIYAVGFRVAPEYGAVSTVGLLLHWDGSSWTALPHPPIVSIDEHWLRGVAVLGPDDLWVVGGHSGGGYGPADDPYVARWDGSNWTVMDDAPSFGVQTWYRDVEVAEPGKLWVVGDANRGDGTTFPWILEWTAADGWIEAPMADLDVAGADVREISVSGPSSARAVGSYLDEVAPAPPRPLVLEWDGAVWSRIPTDPNGPSSATFFGVTEAGGEAWGVGLSGDATHIQRGTGDSGLFHCGFETCGFEHWSEVVSGP